MYSPTPTKELPETYEYLNRLKAFLGKDIVRLNAEYLVEEDGVQVVTAFDHWLTMYGGYLPSPNMRWCTRKLKIRPFEDYVGDDTAYNYIGIRADEYRDGYISSKPNVRAAYPL